MPENETEHGTVWMNPDFSTLTVWSLNFGCADRTRHSQQTILLLCTRQLPEALDFTGSYLSTFPSAELSFLVTLLQYSTSRQLQTHITRVRHAQTCKLAPEILATAETLRELVARWPFFFVFAGWLCNCRKERRRGICWLLSIHFPSLPQGAAVCFWSLWKWVQAAPRMRWLVATGLVLHFRVRHGQTGFPQSVYTDKLLRHVCHVKECPSVSDAHRQCVHREGLLCCFSALHNSLHVFDR